MIAEEAANLWDDADAERPFINRADYSFGVAYPPLWWENEIMQLRPGDERQLEPAMAFHVVPALHVPDVGFVHQSMPVVITNRAARR